MRTLVSIQILRGIAAMLVVLLHAADVAFADFKTEAPAFRLGGAGVDIFFVISGYVMWASTESASLGAAAFWRARFIRIAPIYYLATLGFVGLLWAQSLLPPDFSVREIALSLLFIPFVNSIDRQDVPLLGAGWTLNCEVLFYLVFGAALQWRDPRRRFAFVALFFVALAACRPWVARENALLFRFSSPVFFEFLFGMGVAWLIGRGQALDARRGALLAIVGVAWLVLLEVHLPGLPRTLAWGPPAALLVYGTVCCETPLHALNVGALRRLGDASYSIYLANGIVCHFLAIGLSKPPRLPVLLVLPGTVLIATAAGLALHRWVERPLLTLLQRRYGAASRQGLPIAAPIGR